MADQEVMSPRLRIGWIGCRSAGEEDGQEGSIFTRLLDDFDGQTARGQLRAEA